MKFVISPAKSLNESAAIPTNEFTEAKFLKQAEIIQNTLRKKKPKDLMEMMEISEKLAELNWQRNQDWQLPFTQNNARPAIYMFDGDVYSGLDAYTIPLEKIEYLQENLRILSGLYGILKPLDLMQAYRLEMGTNLAIGTKKNLYEFWKETLTKHLNETLQENEVLVNLASKEYFSAIDAKKIKVPIITPEFKDYKDGKLKMISFFAKKARGLMVRYAIDHQLQNPEDLKSFDYEGYRFDESLSKKNQWVFTR
ncbi:MAG: peroxide stress protein YaaA [Flavobacteriales bacterium]|nr:peroxide stress protein YaaA [Flavobacteriales bacterium]